MNYEELIQRLRSEAQVWCTNCCYKLGDFHCSAPEYRKKDCDVETKLEAADAIEDLMKKLVIAEDESGLYDALPMTVIRTKPEWISVDRQLPDANGFYLALYEHKHPGGVAMDSWLSILQYLNKEWHLNENYVVTHWFPIPEAPKDAEEDE